SSFLADLPVRDADNFKNITKNAKKMPVQLSFDNTDLKQIKNTKESLLIQYLERHYEHQPKTPKKEEKRAELQLQQQARRSHKRKEEVEETEGGEEASLAAGDRPSSSKTRRV
ncbi:hypothetical protein PFISCL1PPCAC_21517, partial [Pristionchus fissidentatus]